jgi:plastocyanin
MAGHAPFESIPAVPSSMYFPLNGQVLPDISIKPGEAQRWRVLNACPHRSIWLHVEGHTLHQIGTDGTPYPAPRPRANIMLAAGNRAEFIIKGGETGRYRVYAAAYDQGHPGGPRPAMPLGTLVVRGAAVTSRMPTRLVEPPRMPNLPVARRRTMVFSGDITGRTGMGVQFLIDGQEFDHHRIDVEVEAGTIEEWTLINEDVFQHPIHIHVNPFQVVDIHGIPDGDTSWQTEPDVWWDTFRLPPFGRYTLRMYFRPDVTGTTVYHCHILPHEDNSMMGTVAVTEDGSAPSHGDAAAGKAVFLSAGCGDCHTLANAGTSGTIGPSLDQHIAVMGIDGIASIVPARPARHAGLRREAERGRDPQRVELPALVRGRPHGLSVDARWPRLRARAALLVSRRALVARRATPCRPRVRADAGRRAMVAAMRSGRRGKTRCDSAAASVRARARRNARPAAPVGQSAPSGSQAPAGCAE